MFILLKKNFQGQQAGTKIDVANADDAKTLKNAIWTAFIKHQDPDT